MVEHLARETVPFLDEGDQKVFATRRPGRTPLVVVEGALDALAVDALAARCRGEPRAVSPSGTALTPAHQEAVAVDSAEPPVLCPDGDPAGRAAAMSWVLGMTLAGHEVVAVSLPNNHDPASWLELHGAKGLAAFEHKGCLEAAPGDVRPVHAGRFLAEAGVREGRPLPRMRSVLARAAACLDTDDARCRFAEQAGRALAQADLGPDGWLAGTLASDIAQARNAGVPTRSSSSTGVSL